LNGPVFAAESDRLAVAVAVIVRQGRVLLARRRADDGAPRWVLPGGKVEPGESPEAAAVREVLEEAGLTVPPRRVLGERVHPATGKHLVYVACDVIAGTAQVADAGELDAVEWIPVGELGAYVPGGFYGPVETHLRQALPGALAWEQFPGGPAAVEVSVVVHRGRMCSVNCSARTLTSNSIRLTSGRVDWTGAPPTGSGRPVPLNAIDSPTGRYPPES